MPSSDEVRGMKDILNKISLIESGNAPTPDTIGSDTIATTSTSVSNDSKEMLDILNRLRNATTTANATLTEEAKQGEELMIKRDQNITKDSTSKFNVGGYSIVLEKRKITSAYSKTYYTIFRDNKNEYDNLALFETAMAITKQLLFKPDESTIQKLVNLDRKYDRYLQEAAIHKTRIMEGLGSVDNDVINAKRGEAVAKMKTIKNQIKTIL
jgi:hypothetical protein